MKVTYKVTDRLMKCYTWYDGVKYVYADGLSQTKLKKLFKLGVKGVYAEPVKEEEASQPEE